MLGFALVLSTSLWGPPALPPETTDGAQPPTGQTDAPHTDAPPPDATPPDATQPNATPPDSTQPDMPPEMTPPGSRTLPPGLDPVPFPLDDQRRVEPSPVDGAAPVPTPEPTTERRRSIVDLRDPFNRPPPRPRPAGQHDTTRLLMPDLKDPFAPGLQRVRSQRLDMYVPNDIRDPFRDRRDGRPPACVRTTEDGTVVQKPGSPPPDMECGRAMIDLRDPFTREH